MEEYRTCAVFLTAQSALSACPLYASNKPPQFGYLAANTNQTNLHCYLKPGVYTDWSTCEEQVKRYGGARYKKFGSPREAQAFISRYGGQQNHRPMVVDYRPQGNNYTPNQIIPKREDNAGGDIRDTHVGKYYAVAIGKVPGIYYDWATAEKQAEAFVRRHGNHFAMVPDFRPDSSAPFDDEFERFASSQGIVPGSQEYRKQRTTAIKREFDVLYLSQPIKEEGEDEDKEEDDKSDSRDDMDIKDESLTEDELILRAFHILCRHVNVEPGPTARDCELAIKRVGPINIVDFLDAERTGKPVQIWPWSQFSQFRKYTLGDRNKCIHLGQAKEHPLLRALLQDLSSKNADEHARYMAAQQNNASALTIIEMRPNLREFDTLLERANHSARTISPIVQEAIVPAAPFQNAHDSSSALRAVSTTPAAAVEVKEEEPELPMNSISQDGPPQATNTEDAPQHQQFVKRESAPQSPMLPTITVARSPPPTIATPGPSSPGGPSQRQPP
ncbi:ribonuclease h [Apiospora hydei]|uniref:Ribonuclease h n=1 Tax=Apiospora hydei TaxID=1337664 RepID=A0ABR1VJC6_9PEZI